MYPKTHFHSLSLSHSLCSTVIWSYTSGVSAVLLSRQTQSNRSWGLSLSLFFFSLSLLFPFFFLRVPSRLYIRCLLTLCLCLYLCLGVYRCEWWLLCNTTESSDSKLVSPTTGLITCVLSYISYVPTLGLSVCLSVSFSLICVWMLIMWC